MFVQAEASVANVNIFDMDQSMEGELLTWKRVLDGEVLDLCLGRRH